MSTAKRTVLALLAVLLLAAGAFVIPTVWGKPWSIDHLYARVFLGYALRHPMLLSRLRILEPLGLDFYDDDLDDPSPAFQEDEERWVRKQREILGRYDPQGLSADQRLSYRVMQWYLDDAVEGFRFDYHDYPVNQLDGVQSGLPDFMVNVHQVNDEEDAEDYLARLGRFPWFFERLLEGLRKRKGIGVLPPRFVVERVLDEMEGFVDTPPREHVLYIHLAERLDALEGLSTARRQELLAEAEKTLRDAVYPSYRRLIDYFRGVLPDTSTDDGVWRLPDGDAYYAYLLRHHTTSDLTPEEVHRLGMEQVDRLAAEMDAILRGEGYTEGTLGERLAALHAEERFRYPDTPEGRQQVLADYQAILDDAWPRLQPLFGLRPVGAVRVEPVPAFKQATAPLAYYQPPPLDGSKPGTFYVNLRDVHEHLKFRMRTLAYHEAIPGHHFQIALAQGLEDVPFFRRVIPFTSFQEGWALYAETLAAEQGFHPTPMDRLGYLVDQMLRAVRLVVDTGIHQEGWTRQQAIDFMRNQTGIPESEVVAEVERYVVDPGQACAYMVGQLEILRLREEARERLGDAFRLADFHDVVLGHGALPLALLREQVEGWIERRSGSA